MLYGVLALLLTGNPAGPGQCEGLLSPRPSQTAATGLRGGHRRLPGGAETGTTEQSGAEAVGHVEEEAKGGEREGEETLRQHV